MDNVDVIQKNILEFSEIIPPADFPFQIQKRESIEILTTIENVQYLLERYGISLTYDRIKKDVFFYHKDKYYFGIDSFIARINSLAIQNRLKTRQVLQYIKEISKLREINSFKDFILTKAWDSKDRIDELVKSTIEHRENKYSSKHIWIKNFLTSLVRTACFTDKRTISDSRIFAIQNVNDSSMVNDWFKMLVPNVLHKWYLDNYRLNFFDSTSKLVAIQHLLTRLDLSHIHTPNVFEGFSGCSEDVIEKKNMHGFSVYPRTTTFCAVLPLNSLCIKRLEHPVLRIHDCYKHNIDLQQLYAQVFFNLQNQSN